MQDVGESGSAGRAKGAKVYKRRTQRCVWMITYASGCENISADMLHAHGIKCDECYTITWRESKYTLIHLKTKNRMRQGAVAMAVGKMQKKNGLVLSSIVGYETLTSNGKDEASVFDHPAFKRMIEVLNQSPADLDAWSAKAERKGMLWKYFEGIDTRYMTRAQLIEHARKLTKLLSEATQVKVEAPAVVKPSLPSVRSTLLRYRYDKPVRSMMKEISKMENRLNAGESSVNKGGEIYAAWNPLMARLHKLGFTCRDAETRVKALQTAGVLEPFQLVRHAHVSDAR